MNHIYSGRGTQKGDIYMPKDVISVEKTGAGFAVRFAGGGMTTVSVGANAQLIHYTNDTITYKENGRTYCRNIHTGGVTSY